MIGNIAVQSPSGVSLAFYKVSYVSDSTAEGIFKIVVTYSYGYNYSTA